MNVSDCARRATVSERTVRAWLRAPVETPEHLPSVLATRKGSQRAGRSHYAVQASDLEALLARITAPAPLPLDAITPGRAAELFAGCHLEPGPDRDRHMEAVRAEAERGRLTAYLVAGCTRYSEAQVDAVAEQRHEEGYTIGRLTHWRAGRAEAVRANREGLLSVTQVSHRQNVAIATVRWWASEGRYGAVKRGRWRFFPEDQLPPPRRPRAAGAKPTWETVKCAVCGTDLERRGSEVRRSRERAARAGHAPLFFCGVADRRRQGLDAPDCLHTEKARTLLGHPSRKKRGKMSDEARRAMNRKRRPALRAAWPEPRRDQQRERARRLNDVRASERARRLGKSEARRYGAEEAEATDKHLKRITDQRKRDSDRCRNANERARRAVELREAGWTDEQIRAKLGITSDRQLRRYYAQQGASRRPGRPTAKPDTNP